MKLFWLSAFFVIFLDRFTKYLILQSDFTEIKIFSFLNLVKVWNKGIVFGLFYKNNIVIITISFLILLILFFTYRWAKKGNKFLKISFGLLFGGGISNLIDRVIYKGVLDFIDLHIGKYHWPVFNVADVFITLSVFLLIYKYIR